MRDPQNEHGYFVISNTVDDHVVFARMKAIQVLATCELRRPRPARVFSEKVEPTYDALLNGSRQFAQFFRYEG